MNKFPRWKYALMLIILLFGIVYAIPNLYGDDPAVQLSNQNGTLMNSSAVDQVKKILSEHDIPALSFTLEEFKLLIRFSSTDIQLRAKEVLEQALGEVYVVAPNLAPATPAWLLAINAHPMKYGLDLQGGVHFLLSVDIQSVITHRMEGEVRNISAILREQHLRYSEVKRSGPVGIHLRFNNAVLLRQAYQLLTGQGLEFIWEQDARGDNYILTGELKPDALQTLTQTTMQQMLVTLRKRVNELGISESTVQAQGQDRISVDLPGVQDTTRAQQLLGSTSTLEFHMVDDTHDAEAAAGGVVPAGSQLFYDENNHPVLLDSDIILQGSAITSATTSVDQNGRPAVSVRLGGGGNEAKFSRTTAMNIGKLMGTVFINKKPIITKVEGKDVISYKTEKKVINVATIKDVLTNSFQITGLKDMNYARDLALLLRSGALPTSLAVIESRLVGPDLGKQNIVQGERSVVVGLLLICLFMILYYRWFGVIGTLGLVFNLIMIVAILSMLGLTLTLSSIAGIVLTVGMAIDANVLINERIREELRLGLAIQSSIHVGYERAFATILDSNLTTLIVAVVLLAMATGSVQGFAVTLTVGILTSMFTAVMVTRGLVNFIYGGRELKQLSIGITI